MGIALFVLSAAIALLTGLYFNAIFHHTSRVKFLLGWFILTFASIVLAAELCSLFYILNKEGYLIVQLLLGLSGWGMWRLYKRPPLAGHMNWHIRLPSFRNNKFLYVFSIVCITAYLVNAVIILVVPQNNYDSMTYHLARVGYWMQNETLYPWDTANPRQTAFPPNAEIGSLWSMMFLRSDVLTGFVQWIFAGMVFLAIYGMAVTLGAKRKQALFAGLIWLTLPQVVLQSTTTQNDIVTSSLFLMAMFFLYEGWKSGERGDLMLSGAALGLALGTKLTAEMAVPGLGIVCLILLFKSHERKKFFFTLATSYILGFLLFGSLVYIQNVIYYGTILGPKEYSDAATSVLQPGLRIKLQTFMVYIYQFLDVAGLPSTTAKWLIELKAQIAAPIFDLLGLHFNYTGASVSKILSYPPRLHEDFTWFGPLSWLGIIPSMVIGIWRPSRGKNNFLLWSIMLVAVLFSGMLILQGWSPHKSRYVVLTVTMLAPLLFFLYDDKRNATAFVLAGIGCFVMMNTIIGNESKPLAGPNAFWNKSALSMRTINNPGIEPLIRRVDEFVPPEARLAVKLGENGWDYVFFGEGLSRTLIQFRQETEYFFGQQVILTNLEEDPESGPKDSTLKDLVRKKAEYFLVGAQQEYFARPPAGLEVIFETTIGRLYRLNPDEIDQPTTLAPATYPGNDPTKIVEINPGLAYQVGVMGAWSAAWEIENYQGDSFLWLGQGGSQGFGTRLWSEEDLTVCVTLTVMPGPSRDDALRTVSFVYVGEEHKRIEEKAMFDQPTVLSFEAPLHKGVNSLGVYILEPATIPKLPNGDERQLLARLEQMEITNSEGSCP